MLFILLSISVYTAMLPPDARIVPPHFPLFAEFDGASLRTLLSGLKN